MDRSRILVVYFSRSGVTREVAQAIRKELHCGIAHLVDRTPREGARGYVRSVVDGILKRPADLLPLAVPLSSYDLVVLGGPIWNGSASTPVRTFLSRHKDELPRIAFFCTYTGRGSTRGLRRMTELAGKPPLLTLALRRAEVEDRTSGGAGTTAFDVKIRTFAGALLHRVRDEDAAGHRAPPARRSDRPTLELVWD